MCFFVDHLENAVAVFSVGNVPETPSQPQPIGSKTGLNAGGEIPVSLHIS